MRNPLQVALDFAVARSREAEALFKEWAPRVDDPEIQALFAELAAAERGRTEMFSRMAPEELTARAGESPELADLLVDVKAARRPTLDKALSVAIRRKGVMVALYDRIARLEGEASSFFRALADEDRRAVRALEAYVERLASSK
jgi:rubrerythrin